ncbi:MAG: Mur ligase family protein [Bacteroidales bacterium]
MRIHFIAIGGSAMHNLAIALHKQGHHISGSDDEIFEPSRSRLAAYDLLPQKQGWDKKNITPELDAVILGMHAKADNPELRKAQELDIPLYSFPSYLYAHAKNKKRIVIGGSHGKTTITTMVLHALHANNICADYMVGAQLQGFEVMVRLSEKAEIMILEGDEYLTSAHDPRPKFHVYKPHIALVSGIAWDHFNVFPTFENYLQQFKEFIGLVPDNGSIIYYQGDKHIQKLINQYNGHATLIPYSVTPHTTENGKTIVQYQGKKYPVDVFGNHNLKNMQGAMLICKEAGLEGKDFFQAMSSFKGASNRLEKIGENKDTKIFSDFAHSPSKVKATTEAVKNQFIDKDLVAVLELHTYSSLNKDFLSQYQGALDATDIPVVFFNEHALQIKRLPALQKKDIYKAFDNHTIQVFNRREELEHMLKAQNWKNKNLLLMSSGNFDGLDKKKLCEHILTNK